MKRLIIIIIFLSFISINAQQRKLQVESNHSTVGFDISIAGFSTVTGKFTDFQIYVDWDDTSMIATNISAEIKAESINTGIPDRDTHLSSSDFFDAEKYPTITFKSDSIQKVDFSNFKAHGKFTMHGVTKNMVLPFQIVKVDGNTIGFKTKTRLNRLDYGVGNSFKHTSMPNFLAKNVDVEIYFWTKKRKI